MRIRNWDEFQHYKKRTPPWIKLHRSLLDDYDYQCLPVASRALAPMLWLLASESENGEFDGSPRKLAFRLRTSEGEILSGLKPLIDNGFVIDDSETLATCYHDAMPETEREAETETKTEEKEICPAKEKTTAPAKAAAKSKRGTRLPDDWDLTDEYVDAAMEVCRKEGKSLNIYIEGDKFKDYWIARTGQAATKCDWLATWRNWIRTALERIGGGNGQTNNGGGTGKLSLAERATKARKDYEARFCQPGQAE